MRTLIFSAMLISGIAFGQQKSPKLPFVGVRHFNFSGGGSCCNVAIHIDKKGNCKIYGGVDRTLTYSGKFKAIMDGLKIYKKNGSVYVAMVDSKGRVNNDCSDFNGNQIRCVFKLEK